MQRTVYLFERFALDTGAHALIKEGVPQQIQEQPYQVLLGLLEADGAIVRREVLHLRLWGRTTFVDFDQSLNSAVRRLRLVLGDDSRQPVFVETLSRIGFRFLPAIRKEVLAPAQVSHVPRDERRPAQPPEAQKRITRAGRPRFGAGPLLH